MDAPTPSQLEAIRTTDQHVLVAAGAGTGKTSTVVGRILYLLGVPIDGERVARPLELRDIAAITYTNAAAADLKRKLREELRKAGRRREAYDIDGARIGTIHAFCAAILREFALRGGLNPGARVLEEGEASALVADAVHESLLRALEQGSVPGLDELFADFEVKKVKEWVKLLAGDKGRLERFVRQREQLDPPARALVDFAAVAEVEVERRLREGGAMDFDRMITWTRDLLAHREPIRRALQGRIRTLIVDEFQDVDPAQRDIAYFLGAPHERRPNTTRLMLVGDPKQSIYRFRRADVTVWREVQADFEGGDLGRVVTLEENFRSVPAIVAFVDASVGAILSHPERSEGAETPPHAQSLAPYEVPHQPLRAVRDADPAIPRAVELITLTGVGKTAVDDCRRVEAAAIASRMRELVDAGASYRDMAVLLTGWGSLEIYQSAIEAQGIHTYALLAEGFYERREVWDLLLALETLRDPREDRALLGFLRSPFVGVKDETLLDIVRQTERPVWNRIRQVKVTEQSLLDFGIDLVDEHSRLRDRVPIHELLGSLLERSGYAAHLVALGDSGLQPLANVRKLLRLAREFREGNVGDFLRACREARKREEPEADERLYGQHEEVVTITSVHSAKGLQWPIVFWADLAREPRKLGNTGILIGRESVALKDPDAEEQGDAWTALMGLETKEAVAEAKRLWYVAATRARNRLILSGFSDSDKLKDTTAAWAIAAALGLPGSAGDVLAYRDAAEAEFQAQVHRVPMATDLPPEAEERFEPRPVAASAPPIHVPAGRPRHSATELMALSRCPRRHWFKYVAGVREPAINRDGPEWGGAVARGLVVHDVLERIREEAELDQLLEAAIGRWDPASPAPDAEPGREYREALAREIGKVRTHPAYRALDDAPGSRRELEFVQLVSADAVLQGKIDLAAPVDGGIAALDVKTGGGGDAEGLKRKAEGYALQRSVYVGALEAIAGRPVKSFAFHFASDGVQVGGEVSEGMRTEGAEEVRLALAAMGDEAPGLTKYPAECRFCGYRRVKWCAGVQTGPASDQPTD
ncbi:MAG: UvrD-helicase domain-containing protein [Gemmatimonadales bacterium]